MTAGDRSACNIAGGHRPPLQWLNDCGFQKLEKRSTRREVQTRTHTKRDDNIRARTVSSGEAVQDGERKIAHQIGNNFLERISLIDVLHAIQHLTEYNAANTLELSGLLQLRNHPVDAVWLFVHIFKNEYRISGVDFILRSDRRHDDGKTTP